MGLLWSVFNGNRTLKKGINHCFVDSFFLLIHAKLVARFEENKKLTQQWKVTEMETGVLKKWSRILLTIYSKFAQENQFKG